ncbi:MAG: ATP-binding protein [Clostridium sp.]|uniref:sensor histidine kinase n=1 Tax=Clostridium sp. TaxID=1506 RepID=UPI00303E88EC
MKSFKKTIALSLLVAFLAEFYFYPFDSNFKICVSVIILNLVILTVDDVPLIHLCIFSGIGVFFTRTVVALFVSINSITEIFLLNLPSLTFYLFYGITFYFMNIKNRKENILVLLLSLTCADSLCNILECILRQNINFNILKIIVFMGFLRSIICSILYLAYVKEKLFILNKEHQKRYTQLNLLISNIQAETVYLKKSLKDIEDVMSKSYNLYDTYKGDPKLRNSTLDIARNVHEIKKDYFRVLSGFESLMNDLKNEAPMSLANIFTIIEDNTNIYIKENNLKIKINFSYTNDFTVKPYYNLFALLNNLIINSIEACDSNEIITLSETDDISHICFQLCDNGPGIDKDILPYIFNPGFTTKFDKYTGKSSTGIGLCHVKNILEDLQGTIEVTSEVNLNTVFTLKIPKNSLIG